MMRVILLLLTAFLCSCGMFGNSNKSATIASEPVTFDNAPDPSSLGDIRIVFWGMQSTSVVLVNRNNRRYLKVNEKDESERSQLPAHAFSYADRNLFPLHFSNLIKIVDNAVMSQLLALAREVDFYSLAQKTTVEKLAKKEPSRDSVVIEKGDKVYLLVRLSKQDRLTPTPANNAHSRAYQALKRNLLRAPGEPVMVVSNNVDGADLLRQNIRTLKKSRKNFNE